MSETGKTPAEESERLQVPVAPGTNASETPPRVSLAFRVGIVGHRPDRLQHAEPVKLGNVLREVLDTVKEAALAVKQNNPGLYTDDTAVLRAISPLAEGTDRIFADQALALGFELCCVLPFPKAEFENDFVSPRALEENSLKRFQDLLARAVTRFELDGCRTYETAAYSAAGRVVLNQSDLLVVVWDGERENKRGGTEETLDEARRRGVPVVWIDAQEPHPWQILDANTALPQVPDGQRVGPDGSGSHDKVREHVREALELPKKPKPAQKESRGKPHGQEEDPKRGFTQFSAERQPRWIVALLRKAIRSIVAKSKPPASPPNVAPFKSTVMAQWPMDTSTPIARLVNWLRPFYAWPDRLSVQYSSRYRLAFILAFLLAAVAVGMALLPVAMQLRPHSDGETKFVVVEFEAILIILLLILVGRARRWHERWIDYRLAAELVRHLRLVAPLGGGRPFPQVPAHLATYGQPGASWMAWYVRAVERVLGLPSAVVDKAYLDACIVHLNNLLENQIDFHKTATTRCHRKEAILHACGMGLLLLTLVSCAIHLVPDIWRHVHLPAWLTPWLTFCCGFFPALGAALAGIINQGEFRRISKRSRAMSDQLKLLQDRVQALRKKIDEAAGPPTQQFSTAVVELSSDAARLLVNEVLDWRVVFLDRPLHPPT